MYYILIISVILYEIFSIIGWVVVNKNWDALDNTTLKGSYNHEACVKIVLIWTILLDFYNRIGG